MSSAIFAEAAELWAEMKLEYDNLIEWRIRWAEAVTNGAMLNKAGRDAWISSESLFTGSESRAMKYASEELKEHWEFAPLRRLAQFEAEWLEMRRS